MLFRVPYVIETVQKQRGEQFNKTSRDEEKFYTNNIKANISGLLEH